MGLSREADQGWGERSIRGSLRPAPPPFPLCRGCQPRNKPVLEAWRQGVQRNAAKLRRRGHRGILAQHDAQRVAGDQRVEHRRILRRAPGDGATAARRHGQAEHPVAERREELVRRGVGQQLALVQQQHAAAAGGLVEIGGGPNHGHAVGAAFLQHGGDDRPEFAARQRIDADRRFVQQQQARAGQQRAGQAELLLHAAGQLARQPRGERRQAGEAQQACDARGAKIVRHGIQVGEQDEIFRDAEVFVQTERLRHITDRGMHRGCIGRHVVVQHPHAAGAGAQQTGEQSQQRGFARAVRANQAGDDAGLDASVDAVQRNGIGIGVAEARDGGDDGHENPSHAMGSGREVDRRGAPMCAG